jgi:hypothetical protein
MTGIRLASAIALAFRRRTGRVRTTNPDHHLRLRPESRGSLDHASHGPDVPDAGRVISVDHDYPE